MSELPAVTNARHNINRRTHTLNMDDTSGAAIDRQLRGDRALIEQPPLQSGSVAPEDQSTGDPIRDMLLGRPLPEGFDDDE